MDIDSCILEYEIMAAAGTIIFLAFFIWAGAIERDIKLLPVVCLVLLASKVIVGLHIIALHSDFNH
jgi:hypothetical protein